LQGLPVDPPTATYAAPVTGRPTRLPQQRLAESIAAELRDRILNAEEGDRLPTQDQLVKDFGVSYPSVREALRILETEGLVTVRRGSVGGAEVHRPDESSAAYHLGLALQGARVTLGDLANGLQMFEPMCAAECARRRDRKTAVVPSLRANLEESAELIDAGPSFTHVARGFHDLVVAHTPNATVRHVVRTLVTLWTTQEELWAQSLSSRDYPSGEGAKKVVATHRRILDAIEGGDADTAERLARQHLAATQAFLVERFDDGIVSAGSGRSRPAADVGPRWRV
jgi:DNA-binding FadR family transcriptional regulator